MRLIDNGRILFTIDRKRVIEGGPWAFEKNLLVLKAVEEDDDPTSIDLNWVDFFVHVHGLSLGRMSLNMAEFIGNQLVQFRDIELDSGGRFWNLSLRIRVGLNANKPLRRLLKLHTVMGAESTISFTYEWLSNLCYWCGHMGHIMKFCECQCEAGFNEKQDPLPFGPWLRATAPAVLQSRNSNHPTPRPSFTVSTPVINPTPKDSRRGVAIFNYVAPVPQPTPKITQVTHVSSQITTDISSSTHSPNLIPLLSTLHTAWTTHTTPIYSTSTPVTPLTKDLEQLLPPMSLTIHLPYPCLLIKL
ncbi:UNVERIFIED_CONTAM: hypothetical protein Slati_1463800 [Sesamum latifolium]|uniref:CCHC-type domain-containing protein n=1 Tax=Sesamum latifolium TaxID=2727402 RepID=A0AAW2X4M9_9LAMI